MMFKRCPLLRTHVKLEGSLGWKYKSWFLPTHTYCLGNKPLATALATSTLPHLTTSDTRSLLSVRRYLRSYYMSHYTPWLTPNYTLWLTPHYTLWLTPHHTPWLILHFTPWLVPHFTPWLIPHNTSWLIPHFTPWLIPHFTPWLIPHDTLWLVLEQTDRFDGETSSGN